MAEHEQLVTFNDVPSERPERRMRRVADADAGASETYTLRTAWETLVKHRWTVVTAAFVVTTSVAVLSFKTQRVYEAAARVEIEGEMPPIQSFNDLFRNVPLSNEDVFLQTQVKVIQSDNLAWQTIQQLGLGQNPEFALPEGSAQRPQPPSSAEVQSRLIRSFRDHLRVELLRDTRMVEVRFQSWDPHLAVRVTNALVNNYTEYNFHKKYDATRQASGWMEQQLDELKAKVEKSQQALVDYERLNVIVNISDKQNVVDQKMADLSKDLTSAQTDRLQKESLYELAKANESQVAFLAQNPLLQQLEGKEADLREQYVGALGQYGPNYPRVVRFREQLNEIQSLMERERKRLAMRIRSDYAAAVNREKLLGAAVAQAKVEVGALHQLLIQHNILKREFETNQQLYQNLLQRLKDATVSAGLRATNIHLVDPALPPTIPVRPKKKRDIALGLMAGLILGVTFAFIKEGLDNSIKSAEEVERITSTPVLAIIPAAHSLRLARSWLGRRRESKAVEAKSVELSVLKEPGSALAESYRALRTSILLSTAPHPPQVLLVTSPQPGEGKTCSSLNLACALAQRGSRVLIVDADLRKAGVGPALGLEDRKGLSSFLTGAHSLEEALQQIEVVPNLWALPGGPRPPNPAELLSSVSMEKALQELRQRFDHVIIDSPPLLLVTDATILSSFVDGVILVVENEGTTRSALTRARRILEGAGGKVLGAVLNKVDLRRDGYYGQYYRRYYYYYNR